MTGLSKADVDRSLWAIAPDGRRWSGAAAVNRTLQELGAWRLLTLPFTLPALLRAEARAYAWVAAHRGRFARLGVTPACARPGVDCLPEGE